MSDSLQIRDLIEMLERIEDKSAPVVVRHMRQHPTKKLQHHEEVNVVSVERTGPRQWSVLTEAPSASLVEDLVACHDFDDPETDRADRAEERASSAEDALRDILQIVEDKLATLR